jgi:hypothetical protein
LQRVRKLTLINYVLEKKTPKVNLANTYIRYKCKNDWVPAIVPQGEYTEVGFLKELERQMGPDAFSIGRDDRTKHIYVKCRNGDPFTLDTMSPVMQSLGFLAVERTPKSLFLAENPSTLVGTDWYLYVEEQLVAPLDSKTETTPLVFRDPEDLELLKIQICNRDGQVVDVHGTPHVLRFKVEY